MMGKTPKDKVGQPFTIMLADEMLYLYENEEL